MASKRCSKCKAEKEIGKFYRNKSRPDGYAHECSDCTRQRLEVWRLANPMKASSYRARDPQQKRKNDLLRMYGLNEKAYLSLLEVQGNACAICQGEFSKTPHVDHCHKTNQVRGLLCQRCNTAIGLLNDDPIVIERAKEYISS